jgi:hypothetical protein
LEKKINDLWIDIKIYLYKKKLLFQYLLKKDYETFDLTIYKIINQLTNYYNGGKLYKIEEIVRNLMFLQEEMIKDGDISLSLIWKLKLFSSWIIKNKALDTESPVVDYKVLEKVEKTFNIISCNMNYDNYLQEDEIESIIRQIKKEK